MMVSETVAWGGRRKRRKALGSRGSYCYCLAGDYVWVADMEGKLLVVMRVVLGGQPTVTGGERKHNQTDFRERKACKLRERERAD